MNLLSKIAIGAGAITGIGYLVKMARTGKEMESVSSVKVHKLDLTGLTLRADVQVKNPTKGRLNIKYPFVKILYKDKVIGSSQSINQDIKIPSYGEARIEAIMIHIPIISLLSIGRDLYHALKSENGVNAQVKTISTIDLGLKSLPYEKTENVVLKKA